MLDLDEQIDKCTKEEYLILLLGDFNYHIFIQRYIIFSSRLLLREHIIKNMGKKAHGKP